MLGPLLVATLECLHASAPAEAADAPPVMDERAQALRTIIVRTTPVSFAALRAELAPRWPEGELLEVGADAFARVEGTSFSYLEIVGEPVGSAPVEITLILSDGRAYVRRSAVVGDDRARALAIAIANLLGAVADEEVPPDRTDAEIPSDVDDEPAPPEQPPEPVVAPPIDRAPPPDPPVAPRPWQLGLQGGAGALVGLAPAERRTRPAFGGGVRLSFRAPVGVAVGTSLRIAGQGRQGHRLTRMRVGVDVAYVGRVRELEWIVGVGPTIEPFAVTSSGQRSTLGRTTGSGATVLYGGALFVSLGYRIALPAKVRPLSSVRIGVTTELAESVLASGASARVLLPTDDGEAETLFSLGGTELSIGVDVTLWFDLRSARARRQGNAASSSSSSTRR